MNEKPSIDLDDITTLDSLEGDVVPYGLPVTPPLSPPVDTKPPAPLQVTKRHALPPKARTSLSERRRTTFNSLQVPGSRPAKELVGSKGTYAIGALIGVGSAARVYKAVAPSGEEVALKMMVASDNESKAVLLKEFNLLRKLDHEVLVRALDCATDSTWMSLELLDAGDKLTAVVQRDELSLEGSCKVLMSLATAVAYLHSRAPPVVHRDVKPDNVLCHGKGSLKYCPEIRLLDFNVAMPMVDDECFSPVGTFPYAAPEVLDCGAYGMAVDIWGVAATACFAFSKQSPPSTTSAIDAYFAKPLWELIPTSILACLKESLVPNPMARPVASALEARCRMLQAE
jgi:serine/threonine protein kinase